LNSVVHQRIPIGLEAGEIGAGAALHRLRFGVAADPELLAIRQQVVECGLRAGVRFVGAVTEAHQPVAGVAQVVTHLLQRLGRDGGELRVGRGLQPIPHQHHERAVEEVARDGGGVVAVARGGGGQCAAVWQLQQREVAELMRVAEIGQGVFGHTAIGACALQVFEALREVGVVVDERGGVLVQHAGLAQQIEAVVGQGQVFFQHGPVAAPLGVALAEHQRVVGQVQQVPDRGGRTQRPHASHSVWCAAPRGGVRWLGAVLRGAHHMCPTLSGIS